MGPHFPIFLFFYLYIIIVNKGLAISFCNSFSRADFGVRKQNLYAPS